MKVIIQRVNKASCTVNNTLISKINKGYLLFVGITHNDTIKEVEYLAKESLNCAFLKMKIIK